MRFLRRHIRIAMAATLTVWTVSALGCASFRSSKRLNLAPFAEDMIAVAGDIQYGLGQTYAVYLRGHGQTPEGAEMDAWRRRCAHSSAAPSPMRSRWSPSPTPACRAPSEPRPWAITSTTFCGP